MVNRNYLNRPKNSSRWTFNHRHRHARQRRSKKANRVAEQDSATAPGVTRNEVPSLSRRP